MKIRNSETNSNQKAQRGGAANQNSEYLAQRRKGRKEKRIVISNPSAKLRVNSGRNLSQIPRIRSG
jgi:hypothetical protein